MRERGHISITSFQDFYNGKSITKTNLFFVPILDCNNNICYWVKVMLFHTFSQFHFWRFSSWCWQQQLHCFSLQSRFCPKWDRFRQPHRQIHQWQNHSRHFRQVFEFLIKILILLQSLSVWLFFFYGTGQQIGLSGFTPPYLAPTTAGAAVLQGVNYASGGGGILNHTGKIFVSSRCNDPGVVHIWDRLFHQLG